MGAALQLWFAHRYYGFLTGDDVEVISEAFRVATGYNYRAWDIRCLFIPQWIVAPPIWIASKLGVHDVKTLIEIATLPFIAAYVATIWLVHRLALRWSGNETTAMVATLLYAFHWIPLAFGSTVYPRTIATLCIVAAAVLCHSEPFGSAQDRLRENGVGGTPPFRSSSSPSLGVTHFIAGVLVGVAFADRFSEIVFFIPLLLVARRRLALIAGAAVSIAITVGVYDWFTWGVPFSSFIKFARLTIVQPDFASRVKYQSPFWYFETLPRWCAFTLLPFIWRARRDWRPLAFIVIPLVALSLIKHKEVRYLQGIIPFLAIAAALGFTLLASRRVAVALLAVSLIWNTYELKTLGRKSMPAVDVARTIAANPNMQLIVVSQIWAYGGWLYFGNRGLRDVETPPRDLEKQIVGADAVALYESDLDQVWILDTLKRHGFVEWRDFHDDPAKAVVVFTPSDRSSR